MQNISVEELKNLSDIDIIDIRSEQNYNNNHIPTAMNIPCEKLMIDPNKYLERGKKYYIYCQRGVTSIKICNILLSRGFNVININGGYEEWVMKKD